MRGLVRSGHLAILMLGLAGATAGAAAQGQVWLPRLLVLLGLASSNAEARRQIEQGGVRLDGRQVTDPSVEVPEGDLHGTVLQVGRRRFVRLAHPNRGSVEAAGQGPGPAEVDAP